LERQITVNIKLFFPLSHDPAKRMAGNLKAAFEHTLNSKQVTQIRANMYWEDAVAEAKKGRFVAPVVLVVVITAEQQIEMVRKGWLNGTHMFERTRYWVINRAGCNILSEISTVEIRDLNNVLLSDVKSAAPPVTKVLPDITLHIPMPEWQGKSFREAANLGAFRRLLGLRQFTPQPGEVVFSKGLYGYKSRLDALRDWLKNNKPKIPMPSMSIMHIHLSSGLANELHKKGWLMDNAAAQGNQPPAWVLNGEGMEAVLRRGEFAVEFISDPTKAPGQPGQLWSIRKPTQW